MTLVEQIDARILHYTSEVQRIRQTALDEVATLQRRIEILQRAKAAVADPQTSDLLEQLRRERLFEVQR